MRRRAWGVLVLSAVLLAAVIVPPALGFAPGVIGTATRAPIPGPPQPGDCLTEPFVEGSVAPAAIVVRAVSYGPCIPDGHVAGGGAGGRGLNYGEIVSVAEGVDTFTPGGQVVPAGNLAPYDVDSCRRPLRDYLGWTSQPWEPVLTDAVALVGPDLAQHLAGQRWIACVVITGSHGYPGSVRDGGFGRAADLYGQCEDTRHGLRPRVSCHDPHDTEVFGDAVVGADGQSGLADSCASLVAARTGMADPTAGGQLQVRAGPSDPNTVPPDVSASGQAMTCSVKVVGDGLLVASLVGIGDRPLPWS